MQLDHPREEYESEFKRLIFKQADEALNYKNQDEVRDRLNDSLEKLKRWAVQKGHKQAA